MNEEYCVTYKVPRLTGDKIHRAGPYLGLSEAGAKEAKVAT